MKYTKKIKIANLDLAAVLMTKGINPIGLVLMEHTRGLYEIEFPDKQETRNLVAAYNVGDEILADAFRLFGARRTLKKYCEAGRIQHEKLCFDN